MQFTNPKTELIYQDLSTRYKRATISKKEMALELNCSTSTIDLCVQRGTGIPDFLKLGSSKNSRVAFNIIDVAEFLSQTIKTA